MVTARKGLWGLGNLYVVDAGSLPSSSAVDPGLTTFASALRVGDRVCERLGVPRLASSR